MNQTKMFFSLACAAFVLVACEDKEAQSKAQAAGGPPSVEVGIITVSPQKVTLTTELPGRTAAYRVAEVRPQVSGIILKRMFTEGSDVKEGQQLYQIDDAIYKATLDSTKASLARAEATLSSAKLLAERYKPLVEVKAVSKQDYDNAVASKLQAEADIASSKAAMETARINLVYTKVQSPISGRIGRSAVTEGALVTAQQATSLATIQQIDPIYVDVTQSTAEILRLRREIGINSLSSQAKATARLILEDGSEYPEVGKLEFSEVTVDATTGSVTLRAVFPNSRQQLLPGMFVHAKIEEGERSDAILIPQRAVSRNQKGEPTAWVVGAENKPESRVLKANRAVGDKWLVTEGLKAGDKLVVDGFQKITMGAILRPVEVSAEAAKPAQGANP